MQDVALMGPTLGGINQKDINPPECFVTEQASKDRMDIPVLQDDQHGTAVICAAGRIDALHLPDRKIEDVPNGAGATVIGPIRAGVDQSMQIRSANTTPNDILNRAVLAACKV
jgi:malate dehydrogenase (oxaloacetate-decarboxylating)(NADP+)